ncbi:hypothetical protein V6R21_09985 [Limibacter armeniacum]|uniref:hypothetical protein n=1 Tax=Limibacter armeniacum TaxID=466084 RepID=UPI002FE50D2F
MTNLNLSDLSDMDKVRKTLRNPLGEVYFTGHPDANNGLLYARCVGVELTSDELIAAGTLTLELLRQYQLQCLLFDLSCYLGGWEGAYEWQKQVWIPSIQELGLKRNAIVMSSNFFGQLSAEHSLTMEGMHTEQLKSRLFINRKEALEWLNGCCRICKKVVGF